MTEQREPAAPGRPASPSPPAGSWLAPARVLLAADDPDMPQSGEEWLRRLRWSTQPQVDVLTVFSAAAVMRGFGLQTYRSAVQEAMREARETEILSAQRIANSVGRRVQESGLPVQTWARHGVVAEEIVAMAQLESSDLVIVSPHGHGRPFAPWRHTVAEEVLRLSDRAVLIARPAAHGDALPGTIVVVGTDAAEAESVLHWLMRAGWLEGTHVVLTMPRDLAAGQAQTAIRGGPGGAGRPVDVRIHEVGALSPERVIDLAARVGADLVAVSRPRRRQVPDHVAEVVAEAAASVLVVPFDRRQGSGTN